MFAAQCTALARGASFCRLLCGAAGGFSLLAATPALSQTCGAFLGSPYSVGGCVVPGQYGSPSVRIESDPVRPGGFRATPVAPAPTFNGPMPPGLNRDYSRPSVPGLS
jgi:hypothetical protein